MRKFFSLLRSLKLSRLPPRRFVLLRPRSTTDKQVIDVLMDKISEQICAHFVVA